ncbi:hypothetical protein E2320_003635 [Naja naja]|nr:hypothetical protein E2320_003635 [Naja naja]
MKMYDRPFKNKSSVPPSPLLRVDLLSQAVKEGDPLVFLCSTEGGTTEKKFHFYKDGVEITSSEESLLEPATESTNPLQNASLRIPHASFNHSGEFACSYEEKRSNRWIMSSWSQGVNITVEPVSTQDSDPIWRYSRVAITIIILLVPFAFYCWTKKSEFPPMEQSQLAEKKKERGDLGMMEPPASTVATASPVKDSEATYSNIQDSFTVSPGPTKENCLTQEKTGGTLWLLLFSILFGHKGGQEDAGSSLLQRESLWCGEEGRGAELCPGLGGRGCDVLGLTQEKLQFFVSLGKEEESDRSQDHLPRNPEEKMETIPWMTASHLLQPIREEEEDVGDESLAQPGIMSPSRNSTFLPSLFQSFRGSSWKQVRDPHASLPCLHKKRRLGLLWPLKEGEGPMKPEAQREIQKEKGPSLWDESYLPIQNHHLSNNTFNVRTENVSSDQIICTCKFTFRKFVETSWGQLYSPESNQQVFSVVDFQRSTWNYRPAAPTLSWSPSYQILVKGDHIELKCSPPKGWKGENYIFEHMNEKELPPAPSLSPDPPEPLYLVGENVVLWCSLPNTTLQDWRWYQFSHIRENKEEPSTKDLDWHEGDSSLILTATRENSGLYKCRYLEWKSERNIPSEWSRPVPIVLHPSSGSLGILSILCLSSGGNNTKRFHFSQDGVEMTSSHEEPVKSSRDSGVLTLNMSVAFLYAKDNERLRFACRYEENMTGCWITSPWSQTVNITDELVWNKDFDFIWSHARMAIPLTILLVPFAFYYWKKKSSKCSGLGSRVPLLGVSDESSPDDSEATYRNFQDSFTPFSPGARRENCLTQEKTGKTLYYDLESQLKKKEQKHP